MRMRFAVGCRLKAGVDLVAQEAVVPVVADVLSAPAVQALAPVAPVVLALVRVRRVPVVCVPLWRVVRVSRRRRPMVGRHDGVCAPVVKPSVSAG